MLGWLALQISFLFYLLAIGLYALATKSFSTTSNGHDNSESEPHEMDDQTRISHSNWAKLKSQLKRHEGLSLKPYVDTTGHVSIGYGRNLDDRGISKGEAEVLLHNDMSLVEHEASNAFTWYDDLSDVRKCVVMNMVFNMGAPTVGKFKKMIQAIEEKRFDGAAQEMLDSKWAEQVGNRAKELADMMFTDRWPS